MSWTPPEPIVTDHPFIRSAYRITQGLDSCVECGRPAGDHQDSAPDPDEFDDGVPAPSGPKDNLDEAQVLIGVATRHDDVTAGETIQLAIARAMVDIARSLRGVETYLNERGYR